MTLKAPSFDLTGRIALVTGGTRGVGGGIAEALAASGAHVVITARDKAFYDQVCRRTPAGRWGDLAELGAAAMFLSSTSAGYGTGSVVTVDGGLLATF